MNYIEIVQKWLELMGQVRNGYHMSEADNQELIRLNHYVMELSHKVHNDNMLKKEK